MVILYIGITLQVLALKKFLVLLFDTEVGRLCSFTHPGGGGGGGGGGGL